MRGRRLAPVLLAALLLPGSVAGAEDAGARDDLELLEAVLDKAVRQVSRPSAFPVLGVGECRGYVIRGVGVVFVLPPRALPSDAERLALRRLPGPAARPLARRAASAHEREVRASEAQAEAMAREAERARRAAEQALAELERQIRVKIEAPPPPAAPAAPSAPTPPAPPAPPWSFWFQSDDPEETRSPETVVSDVRAAVTQALEAHGGRLRRLRPEELLVTAVDFVPSGIFFGEPRSEKTLVIRVRKKDLDERQAGKISAEELRQRIEAVEY